MVYLRMRSSLDSLLALAQASLSSTMRAVAGSVHGLILESARPVVGMEKAHLEKEPAALELDRRSMHSRPQESTRT